MLDIAVKINMTNAGAQCNILHNMTQTSLWLWPLFKCCVLLLLIDFKTIKLCITKSQLSHSKNENSNLNKIIRTDILLLCGVKLMNVKHITADKELHVYGMDRRCHYIVYMLIYLPIPTEAWAFMTHRNIFVAPGCVIEKNRLYNKVIIFALIRYYVHVDY